MATEMQELNLREQIRAVCHARGRGKDHGRWVSVSADVDGLRLRCWYGGPKQEVIVYQDGTVVYHSLGAYVHSSAGAWMKTIALAYQQMREAA